MWAHHVSYCFQVNDTDASTCLFVISMVTGFTAKIFLMLFSFVICGTVENEGKWTYLFSLLYSWAHILSLTQCLWYMLGWHHSFFSCGMHWLPVIKCKFLILLSYWIKVLFISHHEELGIYGLIFPTKITPQNSLIIALWHLDSTGQGIVKSKSVFVAKYKSTSTYLSTDGLVIEFTVIGASKVTRSTQLWYSNRLCLRLIETSPNWTLKTQTWQCPTLLLRQPGHQLHHCNLNLTLTVLQQELKSRNFHHTENTAVLSQPLHDALQLPANIKTQRGDDIDPATDVNSHATPTVTSQHSNLTSNQSDASTIKTLRLVSSQIEQLPPQ